MKKPTRKLHLWTHNKIIQEWTDPKGRVTFRVGRLHKAYYIERVHVHYAGLAGLTVRLTATKEQVEQFTPEDWVDP